MRRILNPPRAVALLLLGAIAFGTMLLALPVARAEPGAAPLLVALFTATSAVCVTGHVLVDTGGYWSGFGQAVILGLIQLGGFGMMTAATLLGLLMSRSLRLSARLATQTEAHVLALGDVVGVARTVLAVTLVAESLLALLLVARLRVGYGLEWPEALWSALFHAVSAFNNAGFSLYPDNLVRFSSDAWVLVPVMLAIVAAGIGFPVYYDLRQRGAVPRRWSLHTKLTLTGTLLLFGLGFVVMLVFESANPATLGPMGLPERLLNAAFLSVSARTAGFNTVDIGALTHESLGLHYLLMFVGGGTGGTAGGVKVATVMVLLGIAYAEVLGRPDAELFGRRIGAAAQRQAITVLVLASACVSAGTLAILAVSDHAIDRVIFEVISAFGTVGLSTGITAELPPFAHVVLIALMIVGRVGTITLAAALMLAERRRSYRYPEEAPLVG
ncbi:MAG: TrkH family potassium uptake protein [Casimicrobiaceae bacterium]|nr:TrkH family potassium uptake protein [Casimicrobiaceae bacterium]